MVKVICVQCGSVGVGETPEAAWKAVPHDGHSHSAEYMSWQQAEASGHGVNLGSE